MKQEKQWGILLLSLTLVTLVLLAAATAIIDPYFHYHAPLDSLAYPLDDQRYQNDGITRHFDYDAMITGTSMTENFKTSELDALFGVQSIKVSYSGAGLSEIHTAMARAAQRNPNLKLVVCGIDQWFLLEGWELLAADGASPEYLYDDRLANDASYLLNKNILFEDTLGVLDYTRYGGVTTTFDEYSNWNSLATYGPESVLRGYRRLPQGEQQQPLSPEEKQALATQFADTLLFLAREHPDIQFVYFYPPYSVLAWDRYQQEGSLHRQVEAYHLVSSLLLEQENIQLYSFFLDQDLVTDLTHYKDFGHYSQDINSWMLLQFASGKSRLTPETNDAHWEAVREFYTNFDYDAFLASGGRA